MIHEVETHQDAVRFNGPLAKHLKRELDSMLVAYAQLREFVQVDEWEPQSEMEEDGQFFTVWRFNKSAFAKDTPYPKGYAEHLSAAASKAIEIRKAYQRLQLVSQLHLLEVPLAGWLLKRRFKTYELQSA